MKEIEKKILRFLIDGKAYSDGAIIKNFGITESELKEIYKNLLEEGYLETYESYEKRSIQKKEDMNENSCGCGFSCSSGDKGCKSSKDENGCGCEKTDEKKGCCGESGLDKSKILVLTDKVNSF